MLYSIRKAEEKDLPSIMEEIKIFSKFQDDKISMYGDDDYSKAYIAELVKTHLFLVSVDENDSLVGFISGWLTPHMFNPEIRTLVEAFWWVKEKHRRTKAGKELLDAFVKYGKENVDWVVCTIEHNSPVNNDVFLKRGFKLKETSFLMEV